MEETGTTTLEQSPATPTSDAPAPVAAEPADPTERIPAPGEEAPDPDQPSPVEDDHEEVDFGGKKYKVHRDLKPGLMMQADYTRKTQEVAATRKELETREQTFAQQAKAHAEFLDDVADLRAVDKEIAKYDSVNWEQEFAANRDNAEAHWRRRELLREQKAKIAGTLQEKQQARSVETQRETSKRIEETRDYAQKNIPNWSPQLDAEIAKFAESEGVAREALASVINPAIYRLLHKAFVGHQLLNKPAPKPPAPTLQPLAQVTARAAASPSARKSLAEMDMEEYAAARRAGRRA